MSIVPIYTDCEGVKQDAIAGVSQKHIPHSNLVHIPTGCDALLPKSLPELVPAIKQRMAPLVSSNPHDWCATIQRGFFSEGSYWYLTGIVALKRPDDDEVVINILSSVPFPKEISKAMFENFDSRFDLMKLIVPLWGKGTHSMYEALAKEPEKDWMQVGLRTCIKSLLI